jgi:hypothetical protein
LPILKYVPSVTWITGHYPKGVQFYKWLAEHGWDESQAIKQAAGDNGSKVHDAISAILRGEEVRIDSLAGVRVAGLCVHSATAIAGRGVDSGIARYRMSRTIVSRSSSRALNTRSFR